MAAPAPTTTTTTAATTTTMATPAVPATPTACKTFLAGALAGPLQSEVKEMLEQVKGERLPKLVGFLATADAGSATYAEWTGRTFAQNGFDFELRNVEKEALEGAILEANVDDAVDGIIVYYPIFHNRQDQYTQQLVAPGKDVEALGHQYVFNMYQNIRHLDPPACRRKSLLPCTPLAIVKILETIQVYNPSLEYGQRLFGRRITIVNRSEVVGRPLAALLANDGAQVFSVDVDGVQEFTRGPGLSQKMHAVKDRPDLALADCLPLSDVVISGVPGDAFKIPVDLIKEGAICVNFSSQKNFPPSVKEKASIYVPAIGKMTITVLMRNLLRLVINARAEKAAAAASANTASQ